MRNRSNTAEIQPKKRKVMPKGKPFKKNDPATGEVDARINRNGRPKSFDQLRALGQQLAQELAMARDGKPMLAPDGKPMTIIELIMRQMMQDPKQRLDYIYIAYGKPNERLEHSGPNGGPIPLFDMDVWKKEREKRLKQLKVQEE